MGRTGLGLFLMACLVLVALNLLILHLENELIIKMCLNEQVDETGSESCPRAGFVISCVETSDSTSRVITCVTLFQ